LTLEPRSITSLCLLAMAYDDAALPDSARVYARQIIAVSSQPSRIGVAAKVLAQNGDRSGAELLVRRLEATPVTTWTRWTGLALAYVGLGDTTRAISAMEHAAAGDGDEFPTYAPRIQLPSGPRVDAVLRRYNLDPARFVKKGGAKHQ
jgi:Flp pilus assembly protein TadD